MSGAIDCILRGEHVSPCYDIIVLAIASSSFCTAWMRHSLGHRMTLLTDWSTAASLLLTIIPNSNCIV